MDKVSDDAKISLLKQNYSLLDVIDGLTIDDNAKWEEYFCSIDPAFTFYKGLILDEPPGNSTVDCIKLFRDCVFLGITPPAMAFVHVAECFDRYIKDADTLSLDEAFRFKGKPKIGGPLKVRQHTQKKSAIYFAIDLLRRFKKLSIEEATSEIINRWDLDYNDEALKKDFIKFAKEHKGELDVDRSKGLREPEDLELLETVDMMIDHVFNVYTSGVPKPEIAIDREDGKNRLKSYLLSCIEQLGEDLTQLREEIT